MTARTLLAALTVVLTLSLAGCNTSTADGSIPPTTIVPNTSQPECELQIELPATLNLETGGGYAKIRIKNVGCAPVTLVMPGDGSLSRKRTPIVGWSFLPVDSKDRQPRQPPHFAVARCGNINRLSPEEVFALKPGDGRDLDQWLPFSQPLSPGRYRVVLYYSNVPGMKWSGISLGQHDDAAMRRLKRSTPISLVSNEVQVEITK